MTALPAPTQRLLEASLEGLLPKLDAEVDRVVVYRANPAWTGPDTVVVRHGDGPVEFRVVGCGSALAVREALVEAGEGHLVILTDRSDDDLGLDVLARVSKRRVLLPDAWEAVKVSFQARQIDPALVGEKWMPEALLESAPVGGFPPVPAGMLDAETAWRWVLDRWGFREAAPSVESLVRWTLDAGAIERWRAAPADRREAARRWIESRSGGAARAVHAILDLAEKGEAGAVLPLGLVLGVVFDETHRDDATLKAAAIRMEPILGVAPVEPALATTWAKATSPVVADLAEQKREPHFEAAAQLLKRVQATAHAFLSPWLPLGLTQRLDRYGERLREALAGGAAEPLEEAARSVRDHRLSTETAARAVEMATRLVRWIGARREPASADFGTLLAQYSKEGSFVDWARTDISLGAGSPALADALGLLRARVDEAREQENLRFAAALAQWLESGATEPLPIERVLDEVVVPLAKECPVLLLVLDGMSGAVFRELIEDLTRQGWTELVAEEPRRSGPVVAVLPSVTEMSRTSLFCGKLVRGDATTESRGFEEHAGLRGVSGRKPVLFHKEELIRGGVGLPSEVSAVIADGATRVVGVVVNAVDDWLLKGEQIRPAWTAARIVGLEAILQAAREGGRQVVLLSDHGHMIERGTEYRAVETEGERWRSTAEPVVSGEIRLGGPRVRAVAGADIVVPCTERLRYGAKRNGYHGGATPQEVMAPLAVLTLSGDVPAGWREAAPWSPEWWSAPASPEVVKPPAPVRKPKPAKRGDQLLLVPPPAPPPEPPSMPVPAWVGKVLGSAAFLEQLQRNARLGLDAERARRFLEALAERGGTLPFDALARRLDLPAVRLTGLVAAMRRVLNLDGYSTLTLDEASKTVIVNTDLVRSLFGVDG